MSGLADRIAATERRQKGPRCRVAHVFAVLDGTDTEALQAALDDPTITARQILDALQPDHDIGLQSLIRHRQGTCRCPRG